MKDRGLSGSVRADETDDVACLQRQAEAIDRGEPAESLAHGVDLEQAHRRRRTQPMMPWGRNEMTRINTRPYSMTSTPARPRIAARDSSDTGVSTNAPTSGPSTVPAPPTIACSSP